MIAITVKVNQDITAVQKTVNCSENAKLNTIKFSGKFINVPTAVSLIASRRAALSERFILLIYQIDQSAPVR